MRCVPQREQVLTAVDFSGSDDENAKERVARMSVATWGTAPDVTSASARWATADRSLIRATQFVMPALCQASTSFLFRQDVE